VSYFLCRCNTCRGGRPQTGVPWWLRSTDWFFTKTSCSGAPEDLSTSPCPWGSLGSWLVVVFGRGPILWWAVGGAKPSSEWTPSPYSNSHSFEEGQSGRHRVSIYSIKVLLVLRLFEMVALLPSWRFCRSCGAGWSAAMLWWRIFWIIRFGTS